MVHPLSIRLGPARPSIFPSLFSSPSIPRFSSLRARSKLNTSLCASSHSASDQAQGKDSYQELEGNWQPARVAHAEPSGEAANSADKPDGVDPGLCRLLGSLGIESKNILQIIHKAQQWWKNHGSHKSGKIVFKTSDFDRSRAENVLSFLVDNGVRIRDLGKIVTSCPQLLVADIEEELAPFVALLGNIGLRGSSLVRMIVKKPEVLLSGDWKTIENIVKILKLFQFHDRTILKILNKYPLVLCLNIAQLRENTELLTRLILMEEDLLIMISSRPDVLCAPAEMLQGIEDVLQKAGLATLDVKALIHTEPKLMVHSPDKLQKTIDALLSSGMTREQLCTAASDYPKLLLRSAPNIQEKLEFLLVYCGRRIEDILAFPAIFDFSMSGRIGPRFVYLKTENPEQYEQAPLNLMINATDKRFARSTVGCLYEEYVVFKEQWSRLYESKFKSKPGKRSSS